MSFGTRLRELRKNKNLTQQELGDIVHVSKVSISGYERGERSPDRETLTHLADYFNVSTDYLLGRSDESDINKSPSPSYIETIAAHMDDNLTEEQFNNIIDYIDFITNKHKKD